jgi:hypothetical protein
MRSIGRMPIQFTMRLRHLVLNKPKLPASASYLRTFPAPSHPGDAMPDAAGGEGCGVANPQGVVHRYVVEHLQEKELWLIHTMTPTTLHSSASSSANDLPTLPVANPTRSFWHATHPNPLVHHRTTPDLPRRGNVVVIGSGITGAFAVRELVTNGITDVVVLEARELCSGATGRVSCCIIE